MAVPCIQEEFLGRVKEFMSDFKSMKSQMTGIIVAIIAQIVIFGFLWGQLTGTVSKNSEYLWGDITTSTKENTRNLDRLMTKLEDIKFIAIRGETGLQGLQGVQGRQGVQGIPGKDAQ